MLSKPIPYDGTFTFCRIMFRNASNGDGGGWYVDYPRADQNLSFRFSELTTTQVSRDIAGNFNHVVIQLTDADRLAPEGEGARDHPVSIDEIGRRRAGDPEQGRRLMLILEEDRAADAVIVDQGAVLPRAAR